MLRQQIDKQTIMLAGTEYSWPELRKIFAGNQSFHSPFQQCLFDFLTQWFDNSPTIPVQTSGSTGIPKQFSVEKSKMINSAIMTCRYLQLKPKDKALLCMPLNFIAGKMMVVRALVANLDLYLESPTGQPLKNCDQVFQFSAMVPLQVFNSLNDPIQRKRLTQIQNLLIGGGIIDFVLLQQLAPLTNRIYATYGMTETLSHIALSQINGKQHPLWYKPLDGITISLSNENTLIINAPTLTPKPLITNDIANITANGEFCILGRKDNVINSGGIKIYSEEVEAKLASIITGNFAIAAQHSEKFGQCVVLITETETIVDITRIQMFLPRYQQPKYIYRVAKIPLTESGKINRAAIKLMLDQMPKNI